MSHVKQAGSKAEQGVKIAGKRLGIKLFEGQTAKAGNILVRQRGTVFYAGKNTKLGRDHTIYAIKDGIVKFRNMVGFKRGKKYVDIVETAVAAK